MAVAVWNYFGGKPEGLEGLASFFEADEFTNLPAIKIKKDIWNAHGENRAGDGPRLTAPAEVSILTSVLPYTDIMILGEGMNDVIKDKLGLDSQFDIKVYAPDEHEQILAACEEMSAIG
jgi:hypothetical protein